MTSEIEFSNSPNLDFKVLQNAFKIKKTRLELFLKVINKNYYTIKTGFIRLFGFYAAL